MDKIEQINECGLIKIKCHKQFLFFLNKFDKPKILF